jgi:hypothetical protein
VFGLKAVRKFSPVRAESLFLGNNEFHCSFSHFMAALLVIGSVAAVAGTAAYVGSHTNKRRYRTLSEDENLPFDDDLYERDPAEARRLTKQYCVAYPEILIGWKIRLRSNREGTVIKCRRPFMRATRYDILFTDQGLPETVILNRKNKSDREKYKDFELVSREF